MTNESKAYGTWSVTTEGDCEGRSTRSLGVYRGFMDEIAFHLASKAEYTLTFNPLTPQELVRQIRSPTERVHVRLDMATGTWTMGSPERAEFFRAILEGRPVRVWESSNHAAVELVRAVTPEQIAAYDLERLELLRQAGLSKLTPEERAALGLK